MGRPEAPLDAQDEALREFAVRLRRLRERGGSRSYRQLARSANFAPATLARAASGRRLPSWDVTRAYVTACGGDPDQWRPLWLATARRVGHAFDPVQRAAGSGTTSGFPVRQLPAEAPDFVGRATEIAALVEAGTVGTAGAVRAAPRVVVVSGPGGIGKTTLALHAAHRLARRYPDGQLFADLHGHDEHPMAPSLVAGQFLAALRGTVDHSADPPSLFRSLTADLRLLVVLDNAADEAQVSPLLPGSARSLVIVTSRRLLGGLPRSSTVGLDAFDHEEAVELLSRLAGPGLTPDAPATESLAELCGRYPLALRIVGSRLATSPVGSAGWWADRLRDEDQRLRRLVAGAIDLSAVFAVSYRSLPELARRTFRAVALFPGPDFGPDAVAVLADLPILDVECAVEQLLDASLVQSAGVGRYRIHDLLRLYGLRRAEEEGVAADRAAAIRRLSAWYLDTLDGADRLVMPARGRPVPLPPSAWPTPDLPDVAAASAWYDAEQANLVAITRAASHHGIHDIAWRLAVAARGFQELRGHLEEWMTAHRFGADSARILGDRAAEAWILNGLGIAHWRRGSHDEATACYRKALDLRTQCGDLRGIAVVLNNLANVYGAQARYAEATACLGEALTIRDKLGDALDKSFALNNLGHLHHETGRHKDALPLLEEALRIRRQLGNRNGEATTLHCLGDALTGLGRHAEALSCLRRALARFRELDNRYGEAAALHSVGSTCRAIGRPDRASHYLRLAITLYGELGHQTEEMAASRELSALGATSRTGIGLPDGGC